MAQKELETARQALFKSQASPTSRTAQSPSTLLHDTQLVQKAMEKFDSGQPLSMDDANSALIPEVRSNLTGFVGSQKFQEELVKVEHQNDAVLANLVTMAASAAQLTNAIQSMSSGNPSATSAPAPQAGGRSPASVSPEDSKLSSESSAGTTKNQEKLSPDDEKQAKQLAEALAKLKGPMHSALRDKLSAQLSALRRGKGKKADASAVGESSEAFAGSLSAPSSVSTAGKAGSADGSGRAAQAVSSLLEMSKADPFTLAGSDTEAAVKKLMNGNGAAATDGSIAERESPTLFERVHQTLAGCVRRECVAPVGHRPLQ